jgi:fluoroacetyl-CoA thioesterase
MEWACIQAINPHIDWPRVQTVGVGVNVTHTAATPPSLTISIQVWLTKQAGRKLTFEVIAWDEMETIGQGTHERYIIDFSRFKARANEKLKKVNNKRVGCEQMAD